MVGIYALSSYIYILSLNSTEIGCHNHKKLKESWKVTEKGIFYSPT